MEDQLNDLTELHQHETGNLKQELASIEEKVAYQAYERARDIQVITASSSLNELTIWLCWVIIGRQDQQLDPG